MFFNKNREAFKQEVESLQKKIKYAEDQREIYKVELEECRMQLEAIKSELAELCAEKDRLQAVVDVRCDSHTRAIIQNLISEIQEGPACAAAVEWMQLSP